MQTIALDHLDRALRTDIADDRQISDYAAYRADYDNATVSNQCWHIVYSSSCRRGGAMFVGSGSSGCTTWTDASSPDDVLARVISGDTAA